MMMSSHMIPPRLEEHFLLLSRSDVSILQRHDAEVHWLAKNSLSSLPACLPENETHNKEDLVHCDGVISIQFHGVLKGPEVRHTAHNNRQQEYYGAFRVHWSGWGACATGSWGRACYRSRGRAWVCCNEGFPRRCRRRKDWVIKHTTRSDLRWGGLQQSRSTRDVSVVAPSRPHNSDVRKSSVLSASSG